MRKTYFIIVALAGLTLPSCAQHGNDASLWVRGNCTKSTGDVASYTPDQAARFERNVLKKHRYLLGLMYGELSTQPDWSKSAKWLTLAAQSGYASAQTALGKLYLKGLGVPKNNVEASFWLRAGQSSDCEHIAQKLKAENGLSQQEREAVDIRLKKHGWFNPRPANWH